MQISKLQFMWLSLTVALTLQATPLAGQEIGLPHQTWSAEVIRTHGQPVIPLFDGWYPNPDGTRTLCFSFFNMNTEQALDVPLGERNYLDDTRFGGMPPTHFDPLPPRYRHVFCAFTVTVDERFGPEDRIRWHLTSNDQALSVPGHTLPAYVLDEPKSDGRGDIAPLVQLSADGPLVRGRTGIHYPEGIKAQVGESLTLSARIEHPDEQVWVGWAHHSGPGPVTFSDKEYMMESGTRTEVQATFAEAGDYVVRLQTIDNIAAFEFYCCHTNAYFHINVSN